MWRWPSRRLLLLIGLAYTVPSPLPHSHHWRHLVRHNMTQDAIKSSLVKRFRRMGMSPNTVPSFGFESVKLQPTRVTGNGKVSTNIEPSKRLMNLYWDSWYDLDIDRVAHGRTRTLTFGHKTLSVPSPFAYLKNYSTTSSTSSGMIALLSSPAPSCTVHGCTPHRACFSATSKSASGDCPHFSDS